MIPIAVIIGLLTEVYFSIPSGSAQFRCYTMPSVAGEINCFTSTPNFMVATIEECCLENPGFFFEDTTGLESCTACIGMERNMYLKLFFVINLKRASINNYHL